ncbi:MAG: hypothetical protein WCV99_20055 [Sterolibacterium sp.]
MSDVRHETIEELSGLLFVVQDMGSRLASETHGDAYALIRELNNLLHQARATITLIKQDI